MNILPTSPHQTFTTEDIAQYFNDMKRWNYDVSYNAFYAFPLKDVLGKYKSSYEEFVKQSAKNGFKSCVQIQSTVGNLDDVSIEHAQHYLDNSTHLYEHFVGQGKKFLFGSFASDGWLEYLKKITKVFRDLGFEWVVFEEPMFHTDIPGTKDKFFELYTKQYPNLTYPTKPFPCEEYYKIQELKQKVLTDFYNNLTDYAKEIGFEKVGIMPWFFSPTFENTPIETWSSSCDTAKITYLENLDFIIIRMQPDNIKAESMIASSGESLPRLAYTEALAHSLGKPTIMVNNPTNEHMPHGMDAIELIPLTYFKKYTLSAFAAAPSGMSRHWYGKNYEEDKERMDLLADVNKYFPKFTTAKSEIAFLFSTRSQAKLIPRSWKDIWKVYWNFAVELQFNNNIPFVTLFADRLKECLDNHPEVKIIILNEYFPISESEINLLKEWISASEDRVLIYFGARNGYRYSEEPLFFSFVWRPSEILKLFDCDINQPINLYAEDDFVRLKFSGEDYNDAFLGKNPVIESAGFGMPVFAKDEDNSWKTLYTTDLENEPVVRMKKIKGGGNLIFSGLSLDSPQKIFPLVDFINFAIRLKDKYGNKSENKIMKKASKGVLYNRTSLNYLSVSNIYNYPGKYEIGLEGYKIWDVKKNRLYEQTKKFKIEPLDFHVLRFIGADEKMLDIDGMVFLKSINVCDNITSIRGLWKNKITIKSLTPPDSIKKGSLYLNFKVIKKIKYFITQIKINNVEEFELIINF